jgi:hypothetical protein
MKKTLEIRLDFPHILQQPKDVAGNPSGARRLVLLLAPLGRVHNRSELNSFASAFVAMFTDQTALSGKHDESIEPIKEK